ncbi:flagellar biosynthesis protein FlhB [Lysinibacillus fusiformis]|jgi:flagellar biosynthetic protein FlhB|uniref:Flagellar biosynthetic protein FlhB n=1 Tax=Lysinibacillus fusiformis TaxID=28031 RepID=A0A1H9D4G2_9BACI|nr:MULTISPECIES: flagellar biosynthesis protein FlhB [Lysinibacillus]HAU34058.1 flagellar biosynthesis protein FlhB [Lysinibacillus sp.]AJK88971.1 flagellar biosynthesis protein FlhB [Lysinibacillus fusiformis]KAB0441834.1 flagellar biosynthesis protein FlhB [Lysinibacillus fusiformis]KEK09643.1 flagellar biosynthesis protein FlhB [Lysinibacillus sphaericus]KGA82813.1 flagellar biosynthesis protein FlhB [Lysinibacillus fusiformis]
MKLLLNLDIQFFSGEKTEKATPKKRQDARKKGQVIKSQDVTSAIVMLMVFIFLIFFAGSLRDELLAFFRQTFIHNIRIETLTIDSVMHLFIETLIQMAFIIVPIMAIAVVGALAGNFLQFGFLFTLEPMKFDLKKMDPIKGLKRIFSVKAIVELLKSVLKIGFIGSVTTIIIWTNLPEVLALSFKSPWMTLITVGKLVGIMGIAASLVLLCVSILDWMYQKFDYEKNLKMSKQDIKDEYKNSEGDPLIKSKIKQRQREMAMRRMMSEIPSADVVITNPTHYAIALKYDEENMDAPRVIAKGTDFIAQKIKLIAKEHDVIMVENRPLARAMYDQVEIGDPVPEEFFKAVAEILAYVYRIKRKI